MPIQPKTSGNDIQDSVNRFLEQGRLLSPDSEEVLAWMTEIQKLEHADPNEAAAVRAMVLHLSGDLTGALSVLDQAEHADPSDRLVMLCNYSKCAEGQKLYQKFCDPTTGNFTRNYHLAYGIGAFHQMATFAREARRIRLAKIEQIELREIFMIDDLLTEFGVSDAAAGEVMETAGSVLTDNGLIFMGPGPAVDVLDVPGQLRTVHLTYRLAVSSSQAVDIYMEFITRLFEREQSIPDGLHISFEGVAA